MTNPAEPKTVALEGPVTIYEAASLRDAFRDALADGRDMRIELDESTKWDLAGLQLLISCVRTAQADGRAVVVANVPRGCAEAFNRAGLAAWLASITVNE
jgi:ABC-type transporter Mla MlaB component